MISNSMMLSLVGVHDEDIASAHVLVQFDRDLAVGETADRGLAQLDSEVRADLLGQCPVGIAGEQHGVEQHGSGFPKADGRSGQVDR
jgi:hypothetical protein